MCAAPMLSSELPADWVSHEFMHRTEACFRALHERVVRLEQERELYMRPTDDQVERVLRKILAEKCMYNTCGSSFSTLTVLFSFSLEWQ